MPFLSDQKIGGYLGPLSRSFFSKSTDQNFEIGILFSIVENHTNNVFGDVLLPHNSLGEGLQVTNFDQCLHIVMVIGKCTNVFRGILFCLGVGLRRGSYVGGISLEESVMGKEKFNEKGAGFSSITIRKQ